MYHNTYVWLLPLHSITLKEVSSQTPWAERCRQHVLGFTGTLTSQAQMRLGKSDPLEPTWRCDPNLTPLVLLVNTNSLVFLCAKGVCLNSSAYKIQPKPCGCAPLINSAVCPEVFTWSGKESTSAWRRMLTRYDPTASHHTHTACVSDL